MNPLQVLKQRSFTVLDLRLSDYWFREGLGLKPAGGCRSTSNARASVCWWLQGSAPGARLELRQHALQSSPWAPTDEGDALGVLVSDFDATLERLAALRTPATAWGASPSRCAVVNSPDGLRVVLTEVQQGSPTFELDGRWEMVADDAPALGAPRPATDTHSVIRQLRVEAPMPQVWTRISDHASMADWLGVRQVTLSRAGTAERNGLGAERTLVDAVIGTVIEQVVDWQPGHGYRYRIVAGSPFRYHIGELRLSPKGTQTELLLTIRFRPRWPGTGGLLKLVLDFKLGAALQKLKALIEAA